MAACPMRGRIDLELFVSRERIAEDLRRRADFFRNRIDGRFDEAEQIDSADPTRGSDAEILICRDCDILVRRDVSPNFESDPYAPFAMERMLRAHIRHYRRKAARYRALLPQGARHRRGRKLRRRIPACRARMGLGCDWCRRRSGHIAFRSGARLRDPARSARGLGSSGFTPIDHWTAPHIDPRIRPLNATARQEAAGFAPELRRSWIEATFLHASPGMPEKATVQRARKDKRQGKAPSTQ